MQLCLLHEMDPEAFVSGSAWPGSSLEFSRKGPVRKSGKRSMIIQPAEHVFVVCVSSLEQVFINLKYKLNYSIFILTLFFAFHVLKRVWFRAVRNSLRFS